MGPKPPWVIGTPLGRTKMATIQEGDPPICGPAAEVFKHIVYGMLYGGGFTQEGLNTQWDGFRGGREGPIKR